MSCSSSFSEPFFSGNRSWLVPRDKLLAEVQDRFQSGARVGALVGPGGAGKTTIALEYAKYAGDAWPGGIEHIYTRGSWELDEQLLRQPSRSPRSLRIVDEFDTVPLHIATEIAGSFRARTRDLDLGLLIVVRDPQFARAAEFLVDVGPFDRTELNQLVLNILGGPEPQLAETLLRQSQGNPLFAVMALRLLAETGDFDHQRLAQLLAPFEQPGLVDPAGRPLTDEPSKRIVVSSVTAINDELLRRLAVQPSLVFELTPQKFEELVAELLARDGFEVTVTPQSRDGGKDIYAASKEKIGSFLYVVECKRYAPDNPVGVSLIRQLYGVVEAERASAGLLVTTSSFTQPAHDFRETVPYRLSLKEYADVKAWIDRTLRRS